MAGKTKFNAFRWGWAVCGLLCRYSVSWQCNIFVGCKQHKRISAKLRKPTIWNHMPPWLNRSSICPVIMRWWVRVLSWTGFFSYVCAHFGIFRRCRIILSRFRLRGQLQYRTALHSAVKFRSIFEIQVQNIAMISSISSWKHTKAWRLTWKQWFEIIDIKN